MNFPLTSVEAISSSCLQKPCKHAFRWAIRFLLLMIIIFDLVSCQYSPGTILLTQEYQYYASLGSPSPLVRGTEVMLSSDEGKISVSVFLFYDRNNHNCLTLVCQLAHRDHLTRRFSCSGPKESCSRTLPGSCVVPIHFGEHLNRTASPEDYILRSVIFLFGKQST